MHTRIEISSPQPVEESKAHWLPPVHHPRRYRIKKAIPLQPYTGQEPGSLGQADADRRSIQGPNQVDLTS
jgi:hypothetical protein